MKETQGFDHLSKDPGLPSEVYNALKRICQQNYVHPSLADYDENTCVFYRKEKSWLV